MSITPIRPEAEEVNLAMELRQVAVRVLAEGRGITLEAAEVALAAEGPSGKRVYEREAALRLLVRQSEDLGFYG